MQSKLHIYPLDVEHLIELAKTDPEAFEHERDAALASFFSSVNDGRLPQLRGVQWRIDQERERSANPLDMCVKMNAMMWDSFSGEKGLVNVLNNPVSQAENRCGKSSNVVPLRGFKRL